MSGQFNPLDHGIFRRFLHEGGAINTVAWNRAAEHIEHVGTCRNCGAHLLAAPTTQVGQITWYEGYCTNNQGCGRTFAAPNGDTLRRSGRHDEMPEGYWARRMKAMTEVREGR